MRLFLALDLPPGVREGLEHLRRKLARADDGWRWVRPEGVHLTVRFLGEVEPQRDLGARPAWSEAARGVAPIRLRLGAPGCFGSGRQPRVLWISVQESGEEQLARLARRVEDAAVAEGFPPNRRPFRAHLTLARARRDRRASPPATGADFDPGIDRAFRVGALTLFRSELRPQGARYTVVERFPLGHRKA